MPTEDPPPPSIKPKAARLRIFGDTMIDHFLTTNDIETFDRKLGRVHCVDRGWFLGGSARIAAYLRHLINSIPTETWYHSPALQYVGYGTLIDDLPLGPVPPSAVTGLLDLKWDQVCTKIRVLNAYAMTETLKFLSVDKQNHSNIKSNEASSIPDKTWYQCPLTPTRIVVFSDYRKGAIDRELIDHVLRSTVPELVVYDGYDFGLTRHLARSPAVPLLVIKGSYSQWRNEVHTLSVEGICKQLLDDGGVRSPIILLSREGQPLEIHTSVGGLAVNATCRPPLLSGLPKACTNGAGDLLTASLLNRWMQLPKLDFHSLFQALFNDLTMSMATAHELLRRRHLLANPFLEPWHTNDADSNQALNTDKVPQSSVPAGSSSGEDLPG